MLLDRLTRVTAGAAGGNPAIRKLGEPWKYARPEERARKGRPSARSIVLKALGR